jgi:membrane-bound acyltransferase YfiQ involved in biofilm formation
MGGNFLHGPLLGAGPTWFIETLLIFSLVYVIWRILTKNGKASPSVTAAFPTNRAIALYALILAVLAFLLRTVFVMDEFNLEILNLQIPFFVQYVALFAVGLVAYRNNWLAGLSDATGRLWLRLAGLLILSWLPLMLIIDAPSNPDLMKGGWHWQSLAYAAWESYMCMAMSIGLVYLFKSRFNHQGAIAGFLSRNAYTAYLIHPFVLVPAALAVSAIPLYPLLKWALVGIVVVPLCFVLSDLVRRLPYTERIL